MKAVAVVLAASLGLLTVGCSADKPVARSGSQATEVSGEADPDGPPPVVASSAPQGSNADTRNGEVRDAKEAAEEAAKKIFDATAGAAAKIRDVGLGAVQAVRESTGRKTDEVDAEDVSEIEAGTTIEDRVGS